MGRYDYFGQLTTQQRSVLLGTLLGDGYLTLPKRGQNPWLGWSHGPQQRDYLIWKAVQFGKLFNQKVPREYQKKDKNWLLAMSSRCHPALREYHDLFYSRPLIECSTHVHKKRITQEILDQVDDLVLAIWWADDGSVERFHGDRGRRDALLLCVGGLTAEEYLLIETWFVVQGYVVHRRTESQGHGNMMTLRFNADDSEHLAARITPHLPDCIKFKLHGSLLAAA